MGKRGHRGRPAPISVRSAIDAATPAEFTGDVHPTDAVMVAEDAKQEAVAYPDRMKDAFAALGQIPPFRVGRSTYRVIAEGVVDGHDGKIALICRTRSSTLHQHAKNCSCTLCGYIAEVWCAENGRSPSECDVWYHDDTRTYHLRVEHGTFKQLPNDIGTKARLWNARAGHWATSTTAGGQVE